ncbi:FUSC family protein [Streptomyces griseorubiginosus]|uniref:FUSC family protein n=1 Tax=Streptomyces griseorubiginosus TaxID=67304 RepID=UPI002E8217C1|nr:FUSC family protein [Streptomyces griseorubiginosus]WUB42014.1 FUSC family protein [Streptomyces griseorubiginosus]WUB50533.1 FUSC family protein [Streptomyces griseorubiginosus]
MRGVPAGVFPAAYAGSGRRAVRVALAAAVGFYLFRYGLDSPVAATYALFGAVALGGLSRIPGTGRQRAAIMVRVLPVCWVLVIVGTWLSVRTWSAVAGMLAVGFALAFSAVGGPRPAGVAPGLQLLYILPSFPPYDPGSLDERLLGTTTGLVLLIAAEALIFPEPSPTPYRERTARAAETAAHCARTLTVGPYVLKPADRNAAEEASRGLRSLMVPEAERPAGPGVRVRALAHTGLAVRTLLNRLARLTGPSRAPQEREVADVLRAAAGLATATAQCLRAGTPLLESSEELSSARAALSALSAGTSGSGAGCPSGFGPAVLRRHAAVLEIADAALAMGAAADRAVRGRHAEVEVAPERFWYSGVPAPVLWWHRVRGHAGRRSVFFQNAVRIALALTAARLVAGIDTLPHGFWAMLATLSLTRTTLEATRHTIRLALTGTLAGALLTAGTLTLVGTHTDVYAVLLPLWMLLAFTVGPVRGVGWAQGLFTVLVALVFAQLAPSTWQLAEVRMLDVLIGSAIGAVFGLLAWPRGAHDELRRAAAELLRTAAEVVVATTSSVAGGAATAVPTAAPGQRSLHHAVVLAESAYAQFQSEPAPFTGAARGHPARSVDWQATLIAGHHTLWGSDRLLAPPVTELSAATARAVEALGERMAGRMLLVSAALDPGGDTPPTAVPRIDPVYPEFDAEPVGAPRRYYAVIEWLESLAADLTRISRGASPEVVARSDAGAAAGGSGSRELA